MHKTYFYLFTRIAYIFNRDGMGGGGGVSCQCLKKCLSEKSRMQSNAPIQFKK